MMADSRQEEDELFVWRVPCFLIMCEFYRINLLQNNDDHNDEDEDDDDDDDDVITLYYLLY